MRVPGGGCCLVWGELLGVDPHFIAGPQGRAHPLHGLGAAATASEPRSAGVRLSGVRWRMPRATLDPLCAYALDSHALKRISITLR
jgi:hypothetical protein